MVTLALYRTGLSFTPHGENIYHPTNRNNKVKSPLKLILSGILILGLFDYNNTIEASGRIKMDFLEGNVRAINFDTQVTRFRIVENDAVIEVRNDLHIRLVDNIFDSPPTFPIIAPMTAVEIVDGTIPENYIKIYSTSHYQNLNAEYHKKALASSDSPAASPTDYSVQNYYENNSFKKDDLKIYFDFTKTEWEEYSRNMNLPESAQAQVSAVYEGNDFCILVELGDEHFFSYKMTGMFRDNEDTIYAFRMEQFFPHGSIVEEQKALLCELHQTSNSLIEPEYSSHATFEEQQSSDQLTITITKN